MRSKYEQFTASVLCLSRCIQKIQRDQMVKYGLKGAHAQCLIIMNHYPGGITATQLSKVCEKDKAAISRAVVELERKGLVQRACSQNHAYRAKICLTDAGRQASAEVNRLAMLAVEQAGQGITDEDRAVFYQTLDMIAGNLQRLSRDGLDMQKE